jgi:hypothetical protein
MIDGAPIRSVRAAMSHLESGWSLTGQPSSSFLESPDGLVRKPVWINASIALRRRPDIEQVVFRDDEYARFVMRRGSA